MNSRQQRIQVLYEISLSVGEGKSLKETARNALTTYVRKLDCSAGAILEGRATQDGAVTYEPITSVPSLAAAGRGFNAALDSVSTEATTEDEFLQKCPIINRPTEDTTSYIMELPDFGVLVLVTRNRELESETVATLGPLNKKLATACRDELHERKLRAERDRFEALFRTIGEPLASVRQEGEEVLVQRINPAFESTFGYDETQAIGRRLSSLLESKEAEKGILPWNIAGADSQSVESEVQLQTTDGAGEFLFRSAPINPGSDQTEHLTLFIDVTDESIRQRRLKRLNEVTKVLSRILRHNIRNDLTVIKAMAEDISRTTDDTPKENAQAILDKSEQLESTAEKAREIRRLASMGEENSTIQLENAIADAIGALENEHPNAVISTDLDIPQDVTVHPLSTLVITHLVENGVVHHDPSATDSGDDAPRVELSFSSNSDDYELTISDNGPGIPQSEVKMIQEEGETDLKHGSGAGLWIVGQVIGYCDLSLDFSVSERGTTATVTIPS